MSKFDSSKPRNRRPVGETKEVKKTFLIYCEGQTESLYFQYLQTSNHLSNITIIPIELSEQGNALTLAEDAVDRKNNSNKDYDEYWIVFDKDDTKESDFQKAIDLCLSNSIETAYSIQAFELWILFHFCYMDEKMDRRLYEEKLNTFLKTTRYGKTKEELKKDFEEIKDKWQTALKNSRNCFDKFEKDNIPIPKRESCSTVFKLVEKLLGNKLRNGNDTIH